MKLLLVAINAKYSHTNLAIRYLKNSLDSLENIDTELCEYTINNHFSDILGDIYTKKPDILAFSCYIWNIELVLKLCSSLKKLMPNTPIILGGPEVSYNAEDVLKNNPHVAFIACGEGENTLPRLISAICASDFTDITGVHSRIFDFCENSSFVDLGTLPFPYFDLENLQNRIIYYESSRGCPYSCSYCLSSAEKSTRFKGLTETFADLQKFIDKKVMQVKFVDRTFNVNAERATAIWKYLAQNDNGYTGFHFEIGADLLTDEQIEFLATVRKDLFQFEIGVQSTNPKTLNEICRATDTEKVFSSVKSIKKAGNIHQHLDLIAGLPFENFERFSKSFDDIYALKPEALQLGFLKLLHGTALHKNRDKYKISHNDFAPYEVLSTEDLSFDELLELHKVEEMVEIYYNSERFSNILGYLEEFFTSAFDMYYKLSIFFENYKNEFRSVGKYELFDILYGFFIENTDGDAFIFKNLCFYDLMLHEKPKKLPECLKEFQRLDKRHEILDFLSNPENLTTYLPDYVGQDIKFITKVCHLEIFPIDVTSKSRETREIFIICDYKNNKTHKIY